MTDLSPADAEIEVLIRAKYPILYIVSWEEERVEAALEQIAQRRRKRLICWSIVRGLHAPDESLQKKVATTTGEPLAALDEVIRNVEPAIYLFKDLHPFLDERSVVRKLREVAAYLKASPKTLVLVSPSLKLPQELEKDVTVLDYGLPRREDLASLLGGIVQDVSEQGQMRIDVPPQGREALLNAALGLTLKEAENAFARSLIQGGGLDVSLILEEKRRTIRKAGILEYYEAQEQLEQVGDLDVLKDWVRKRSVAFTADAQAFGLPPPKGVLLIGVQGCGKSLCARAISQVWKLPLLRLDVGRIFSSFMGSSEENARRAIATAESVAPSLLWIDEVDKAFSGSRGSGEMDGGTTARVLGTFLTWMQEKKAPVFVIATANNIGLLPPELLRKGRFDEIFFVDLPQHDERADIFDIHIGARRRDPRAFDRERLAAASEGFSGSEIEQAVVAALYEAFDRGGDLGMADLEAVLAHSVPLSVMMEEELDELRMWAKRRARMASRTPSAPAALGPMGTAVR